MHKSSLGFQGFETISSTLSLVSLLLAFYPEVQDKIFEELQSVFASVDEEVTEEHLKELVYLEMVIKEVMRFWPTIPFIARYLTEDLDLGNCVIPGDLNVYVPIIHIHRNKLYWGEDADEFRPERFAPENFSKIHPYAYLPFSKGPRNCVGYKYAEYSVKIILAHFFRNFKVSTSLKINDIKFKFILVTEIAQGCQLSLTKMKFHAKKEE